MAKVRTESLSLAGFPVPVGQASWQRRAAMRKKLTRAYALSATERQTLGEANPWYQKLFATCPNLSLLKSRLASFQVTGMTDIKLEALRRPRNLRTSNLPAAGPLTTYRKEILSVPELTAAEAEQLLAQANCGNQAAQDQLLAASLRYILPVAYQAARNQLVAEKGFTLLDLIEEGNLGLLEMIQRRKCTLGDHQTWPDCVRIVAKTAIRRALAEEPKKSLIRIPLFRQTQIRKYLRAADALTKILDRSPKVEEMAEYMGLSQSVIKEIREAMRIYCARDVFLSEPVGKSSNGEEKQTWAEVIADPQVTANPDELLTRRLNTERISYLLAKLLTPTEEYIIRLAFGFEGESCEDWEIAEETGYTLEQIAQIRELAIVKIRQDPEIAGWLKSII